MTLSSEFQALAQELFDTDLPGVVTATFANGASSVTGKLAREFVETEHIQGIRSTFLCPIKDVIDLDEGGELVVDGTAFEVAYKEREGIITVRLILRTP